LTINQKFRAARPPDPGRPASENRLKVAEMFGIGLDETYEVALFDGLSIDVRPSDVIYITGPSGSGKSVLLGRLVGGLRAAWPEAAAADLASITLDGDLPVIDRIAPPDGSGLALAAALRVLSAAGLADAFCLLRRPDELSDGQRWRLRLALALAEVAPALGGPGERLLIADEFCSTLDRTCARAVAHRVRKLADDARLTVVAASAHDDLAEDLDPDVLVVKHEGRCVEVHYRDAARREVRP
jgi:ABC-type ATPase with predicted acetyltransferase domain